LGGDPTVMVLSIPTDDVFPRNFNLAEMGTTTESGPWFHHVSPTSSLPEHQKAMNFPVHRIAVSGGYP
jgi:hypothetical protein